MFMLILVNTRKGSAMLIEFNPLRGTDVTLPETAVFVIAHSQACHNKASTTDYNLRVAECRLAAQVTRYFFYVLSRICVTVKSNLFIHWY